MAVNSAGKREGRMRATPGATGTPAGRGWHRPACRSRTAAPLIIQREYSETVRKVAARIGSGHPVRASSSAPRRMGLPSTPSWRGWGWSRAQRAPFCLAPNKKKENHPRPSTKAWRGAEEAGRDGCPDFCPCYARRTDVVGRRRSGSRAQLVRHPHSTSKEGVMNFPKLTGGNTFAGRASHGRAVRLMRRAASRSAATRGGRPR